MKTEKNFTVSFFSFVNLLGFGHLRQIWDRYDHTRLSYTDPRRHQQIFFFTVSLYLLR